MVKGNQVVNLFSEKVEKVLDVGQFYSCKIMFQFKLDIISDPAKEGLEFNSNLLYNFFAYKSLIYF